MVVIRPRVAAVLSAALSATLMLATLTGAARQPAVSHPVQAAFTPPGPYRDDVLAAELLLGRR